MRILIYIFLSAAVISIAGCGFGTIAFDNIENAIFDSPDKVKIKIKDPVKDDSTRLAALWSGHSTVLLQLYDKVIITDPFLTDHLMGFFERRVEAGLDINNVNKLDMVLVSHAHTDHFSFASVELIEDRFPGIDMLIPEGVQYFTPNFDLNLKVVESTIPNSGLYIYKPVNVNGVEVTPVYSVHSGGRYMMDTYTWKLRGAVGYIVKYRDVAVYFAGDTGYDDKAYKEIGNKFDIDLACIPIGPCRSCESEGFWHHTSSIEALMLFRDLKAEKMIPIHYGSLQYIRDPDQPLRVLKELINNTSAGFNDIKENVIILNEGEQIILE